MSNPLLEVSDIAKISEVAKKYGIKLVVDNTFTPMIFSPAKMGADIVVHSLTKFIGGHGTSIGGIVVDGGNFDWIKNRKRQPLLNEPDQSYGGAVWTDAVPVLTGANIPFVIRLRVVLLRDTGSPLAPFNAWQIIQGLETVGLRMKQHCANAEKVVSFLETQKKVKNIIFPTNHQGEIKERAKKYLNGGNGALVGADLGTAEAGAKFIDNLKMLYHVANIGDARSLAIHPATTTHSQLNDKELLAAGVTPGYVRLSIGIEHPDDIIADIKQALAA
jgi:O-acetylhomoserine (thiol)-lyase